MTMRALRSCRQRGIALPVMLIMLTVMMVSSIYLLRASTSTTLTTSNLAYESAQTRAADAGLHVGFAYVRGTGNSLLLNNQAAAGYVATMTSGWTVSTPAFWIGAVTMPADASGNQVQYVIHRMCTLPGPYDSSNNSCRTTAPRPTVPGAVPLGLSLTLGKQPLNAAAQIHYLVTARVFGPRGGNVVTQAVIMKGP
jgi:hypothetical protein